MFANNCVICYCMLSSGVLYIWKCPNFHTVLDQNKIQHLLGEQADIGREEAICVRSWGKTRWTTWKSVVSFLQTYPSPHSILLYMCGYYWFILYVRASSQSDLVTILWCMLRSVHGVEWAVLFIYMFENSLNITFKPCALGCTLHRIMGMLMKWILY